MTENRPTYEFSTTRMRTRPQQRRLFLVGYGRRGRQWHAACRRRRDVELVGTVDPDPAARDVARRSGLSAWSTIGEALESGDAECALVASPPHEHAEQAIAILRSGLPVLVEKPLALSAEAAATVARESARLGIPVAVGQNFRFLPRERGVRKALAAGFGRPLSAVIISARPSTVAAPHLAEIEHGALWDICLHHLDALRVRFGVVPDTVEMTTTEPVETRIHLAILLRWRDGPSVVYRHSEGAPGFHHSEWIEGERGMILVDDQRVSLLVPGRRRQRVRVSRRPRPEQAVLDDFLLAVREGHEPALGVQDNLATIATVQAVLEAATLGRAVAPADVARTAGIDLGSQEGAVA